MLDSYVFWLIIFLPGACTIKHFTSANDITCRQILKLEMVGFMFVSPSNIDIEKEANSAEANVVRLLVP
jgi:hypothetical protein